MNKLSYQLKLFTCSTCQQQVIYLVFYTLRKQVVSAVSTLVSVVERLLRHGLRHLKFGILATMSWFRRSTSVDRENRQSKEYQELINGLKASVAASGNTTSVWGFARMADLSPDLVQEMDARKVDACFVMRPPELLEKHERYPVEMREQLPQLVRDNDGTEATVWRARRVVERREAMRGRFGVWHDYMRGLGVEYIGVSQGQILIVPLPWTLYKYALGHGDYVHPGMGTPSAIAERLAYNMMNYFSLLKQEKATGLSVICVLSEMMHRANIEELGDVEWMSAGINKRAGAAVLANVAVQAAGGPDMSSAMQAFGLQVRTEGKAGKRKLEAVARLCELVGAADVAELRLAMAARVSASCWRRECEDFRIPAEWCNPNRRMADYQVRPGMIHVPRTLGELCAGVAAAAIAIRKGNVRATKMRIIPYGYTGPIQDDVIYFDPMAGTTSSVVSQETKRGASQLSSPGAAHAENKCQVQRLAAIGKAMLDGSAKSGKNLVIVLTHGEVTKMRTFVEVIAQAAMRLGSALKEKAGAENTSRNRLDGAVNICTRSAAGQPEWDAVAVNTDSIPPGGGH